MQRHILKGVVLLVVVCAILCVSCSAPAQRPCRCTPCERPRTNYCNEYAPNECYQYYPCHEVNDRAALYTPNSYKSCGYYCIERAPVYYTTSCYQNYQKPVVNFPAPCNSCNYYYIERAPVYPVYTGANEGPSIK